MFFNKNKYRYSYVKEKPRDRKKRLNRARGFLVFSDVIFYSGVLVLAYFLLLPLVVSYTSSTRSLNIIKPFAGSVLGMIYESPNDGFYFAELENNNSTPSVRSLDVPERFFLTIPKLNIKSAVVETDSDTLDPKEMLGHYKGTSIPGEVGNSFIYGHSSLPFFYDPSDYKTIFTKLPELNVGDDILVDIGGKSLVYKVRVTKEMLPNEVNPFGAYYPNLYNKSTITLMTCTPPGTKKFRYIVLAELN